MSPSRFASHQSHRASPNSSVDNFPPPQKPETHKHMKDNNDRIHPDLHDGNWEVKIAEIRLRGNTLFNTWYPLLASILTHIGQMAVLSSRSASLADANDARKEHMNLARLASALVTTIRLLHEGGAEHASNTMQKVSEGEVADPAQMMVADWLSTAQGLPAKHICLMDKRVLIAMRIEESDDSVRLHFDETLCGKNIHHDDEEGTQAVQEEMRKQEERMGITNNVPPCLPEGERHESDGVDGDGTKTTTKDHGGFIEVRKTRDRDDHKSRKSKPKPTPPATPKDIKSASDLNAFLDGLLAKKAEQDKKKKAKDKTEDDEGDEPLPPPRFN